MRRSYKLSIIVNDRKINEVIIDPHFEIKHSESINDEIILDLVRKLDGGYFEVDARDEDFEYFKTDPIYFSGKKYRLIWLLKNNCMFIGVVNAFRSKHK